MGSSKGLMGLFLVTLLALSGLLASSLDLPLVEAAKERDWVSVRGLLQAQADVNAPQLDGATALHWAAHWGAAEMVDLLIQAGANPNASNDIGVTPLLLACGHGDDATVKKLIQAGADPNLGQWSGETPLMTCARTGSVAATQTLLDHGADVNAKETERGQTALMWAASNKHSEVVGLLLERDADVNAISRIPKGFTPRVYLTYGVYRRDPSGPDHFEAKDVHLDPTSSRGGFTALMFAARQGDLDSARLLVKAGANLNHWSRDYGSALVVAAASGQEDVAEFLLERGADPNLMDGWGFTALHHALFEGIAAIGMSRERIPSDEDWFRPNMPGLIRALLEHGANPNAQVVDGFPPFDYPPFARTTGNSMPQIRQPGVTPFFLAAASFDVDLMRLLLAHGADPRLSTNEGTTPLMVAAGMGRLEGVSEAEAKMALDAAKMALELGNDVNAANQDGRTALAAAAFVGAKAVVQLLAENGADLDAKNRYGQTALSIAKGIPPKVEGNDKRFHRAPGHEDTAALLIELGATQ